MNFLIDTHVLIWWSKNSRRLGRHAAELISAPENFVRVSAASIWEIIIKASLGRLDLSPLFAAELPKIFERNGFKELPVSISHALAVRELPLRHSDPFDRILVAQARCEDLVLITADEAMMSYDIRTIDASH